MCALGFQGKGYSPKFVSNFRQIVEKLKSPETQLCVVDTLDSICAPCPHQTAQRTCQQQEKIDQLDKRHAQILSIKPGQVLTWPEAKEKIKHNMTVAKFHWACEGCQWKEYGVCEAALRNIRHSEVVTEEVTLEAV